MIENSFNYHDISGLNNLKNLGAKDQDAALKQVAKQFESLFLKMMLSSMREANKAFENPGFISGNESKFYRDMFDEQLTLSLSQRKGIGLADSFYHQMKREYLPQGSRIDHSKTLDPDRDIPSNPLYKLKAKDQSNTTDQPVFASHINEVPRAVEGVSSTREDTFSTLEKGSRTPILQVAIEGLKNANLSVNRTQESAIQQNSAVQRKPQKGKFDSPLEFIKSLLPAAKKISKKLGVDYKAILAQGALETGWGKHIIQGGEKSSYNLFGIKADHRWDGDKVRVATLEYRDNIPKKEHAYFRAYKDFHDSLNDYADFISNSPRYANAIEKGNNIASYAKELQKAGYATDPNYAEKIIRVANSDTMKEALQALNP